MTSEIFFFQSKGFALLKAEDVLLKYNLAQSKKQCLSRVAHLALKCGCEV